MTEFERELARQAQRIRAIEPRPTLSLRFTGRDKSAAEERADRNYYRASVL